MRSTVGINAFPYTENTWVRQVTVTHPLFVLGVISANTTFPNNGAHTHIQDE